MVRRRGTRKLRSEVRHIRLSKQDCANLRFFAARWQVAHGLAISFALRLLKTLHSSGRLDLDVPPLLSLEEEEQDAEEPTEVVG
jgi:hypothetical protein